MLVYSIAANRRGKGWCQDQRSGGGDWSEGALRQTTFRFRRLIGDRLLSKVFLYLLTVHFNYPNGHYTTMKS